MNTNGSLTGTEEQAERGEKLEYADQSADLNVGEPECEDQGADLNRGQAKKAGQTKEKK